MSTTLKLLLGLAPLTAAFPASVLEAVKFHPGLQARANEILQERQAGAAAAQAIFEPVPIFNAAQQYVNISAGSGHEYVAPGPNDLRGPCPGLNAFANHNFLPHNGYATIEQFIETTGEVVGMGTDLAAFLAVYGAAIDGDGTSWSIGGTPGLGVGGPLSSLGNGISGSHNKYESDASPTRPDLYEAGNDYKTVAKQFEQLISMSPGGQVTLESLTAFRSFRFDTQVANNPYFFNGPFTGVAVQPAAYTFIYRFMANHSAEAPYGYLSYDTIKSWFGITGTQGSYKANQGQEKIPDNWYKRALAYPYTIPYFTGDLVNAALLHPKFLNIGGNLGKTNTFTGVDVTNLTGGVFNGADLLKGNNAACLAYQFAANAKPDVTLNVFNVVNKALGSVLSQLNCPQLEHIDEEQLMQFPGYQKSTQAGITK
ncbi:Cloroperoxidase [Aureobasidium sp. EXF-8845]|nr:Cloroperoxidase [Aureobasidium sp. EXF-8845]KAI4858423.1 Cloroperoxidase [Aureobasidium sp. EXF-8846]